MNFEQLSQLKAIEECGTLSAAAELMHISQPALSRSIQRLEAEVGQPLFEREGRTMTQNAAGRIALDYANQILRDKKLMLNALDDHARRQRAITVGTVAPAPLWHLSAITIERFPQALMTSETLSVETLERRILEGTVDLGISMRPLHLPTVKSCQLMTENLSISLPKDHSLARRKTLGAKELNGETILLSAGIGFWMDYCKTKFPNSKFVIQEDRVLFEQMLANTQLPYFISDLPSLMAALPESRTAIPLRDTAAHATFYLLVSEKARTKALDIFEWVRSGTSTA